jgi:hypothetical protein
MMEKGSGKMQGALQHSESEVHCCPAPRQQSAPQLSFMLQRLLSS